MHVLWLAHPELPASMIRAIDANPSRELVAKSKAKGRFRIGLPNRGPFAVYARQGELRSSLVFPVMAGDYFELALDVIPTVVGTVVDADGAPVGGAHVASASFTDHLSYLERFRHPRPNQTVRTDASGRFRLPVWAAPRVPGYNLRSMRAWTEGLVSEDRFYLVAGQSDCDANLRLTRPTTVRGRILTSNRKPLANAAVTEFAETGRRVVTDRDGRFVFTGLHSGTLVVHADGYQRIRVTWPRGKAAGFGDRQLRPGVRLNLRLARDRGGIEGHRVVIATPVQSPGHLPWTTRVGKDGALSIDGLTTGSPISAFVEVSGRFVQFLSCLPVGDRDLGVIRVDDSREIHGQVIDVERRPLAGARVILQPRLDLAQGGRNSSRGPALPRITYTDRGGRFRFDAVFAGVLTLGVNAGGDGFHSQVLPAKTGGEPISVLLEPGLVVTGTVMTAAGKPAAGAMVQYLVLGGLDAESRRFGRCYLRTVADENGRFRFRGLPQHSSYTSYAMYSHEGKGYWSMLSGGFAADSSLSHALTVHLGRYPR